MKRIHSKDDIVPARTSQSDLPWFRAEGARSVPGTEVELIAVGDGEI